MIAQLDYNHHSFELEIKWDGAEYYLDDVFLVYNGMRRTINRAVKHKTRCSCDWCNMWEYFDNYVNDYEPEYDYEDFKD